MGLQHAKSAARLVLGALAVTVALLANSSPARADEGWNIDSFDSDITIAADSTITIAETIRVDFGALKKHGIFRTIPLRYTFDDGHDRFYELNVVSVTDGSSARHYTTPNQNGNEVIQIGDANALVTGHQEYVITYTVRGAMNEFSDHDELYWNVDGGLWPVPKSSVRATVHLPFPTFQRATCYQGPTGSTQDCSIPVESPNTVGFITTRGLGVGEQMSIVVGMSKDGITIPPPNLGPRLPVYPQDAFAVNPVTVGLSSILTLVVVGLIVRQWWIHGRDRAYLTQYYLTNDPREHAAPLFQHVPLVAEFEAPLKMRPAEVGVLLDESADTKDVTATIVDLAVRGYLTITEIPKEGPLGKADWKLTQKSSDPSGLLLYEWTIAAGVFAGRSEVKLSELKGTFADTLQTAERQLYEDSMSKKLFTNRPDYARSGWLAGGCAATFGGVAFIVVLGLFGGGLLGVPVLVAGLLLLALHRVLSMRTAAGRDAMQHALGFRLYMNTAEKYRQQFAEKAQIFTELLPYAIVFGCVDRWAKAFEGIDTTAMSTGWYAGAGTFQPALLSSNLQSLNANISSAITYVPPSGGSMSGFSGGGGGGGFSGGGGGGGGGGSW